MKSKKEKKKVIATNKVAKQNYELSEEKEAGIVLEGSEVKSLRENNCNLLGSFCRFFKNELFLVNCHIGKYEQDDISINIDPKRPRKLLLHKKELNRWLEKLNKNQSLTIVPTHLYFDENGRIKINVSLAKGKNNYDKRQSEKEKTIKRKLNKKDYD